MRFYAAAAIATLAFVSTARAQTTVNGSADIKAPRFEAGISVLGAAPIGEFGRQIDRAFGIGTHAAYRFDDRGRFAIRLDASWLAHGWDSRDAAVQSPFGDTRTLEMSTINSLFFVGAGPEFAASTGSVRPYIGATAGIAAFVTNASGIDSDNGVDLTTSVDKHDVTFAYGGRAGVRIPTPIGSWPLAIDIGANYLHSNEAEFLREGDLYVSDAGTIVLTPVRGHAETLVFHAGVSLPLGR